NEKVFDIDAVHDDQAANSVTFTVLFYGSFLPLHGIDLILNCAALLQQEEITFRLIGGNRQNLSYFYDMLRTLQLNNVNHERWLEYERLPEAISHSDLCLGGPFGNTGQALKVITGKTFQ